MPLTDALAEDAPAGASPKWESEEQYQMATWFQLEKYGFSAGSSDRMP